MNADSVESAIGDGLPAGSTAKGILTHFFNFLPFFGRFPASCAAVTPGIVFLYKACRHSPAPDQEPTHSFNMSGTICSIIYADSDANLTAPGIGTDHQEKLITLMEPSATGIPEDRIAALEKKVREMEALVKGLIDELLDFKAIAMKMSRQDGERSRLEMKQGLVVPVTSSPALAGQSAPFSPAASADGSTVIRPRGTRQPDVPVAPAEPAMVRIMQNDGTMKMEPRCGDRNPIDSSGGYGRNKAGTSFKGKQAPLIYAADKEPAKK